jgi:hypothetical protein
MLKVGDRVRLPGTLVSPPQASSKLGKGSKSKHKGWRGLTTRVRVGLGRGIPKGPQMGNGASLVPERCQNSAEPLERNKRLAERN